MTTFDFDTPVNRRGTLSYKWDSDARFLGESDVLPMWVADMDFRCPQPMLDAFEQRIRHGVFGYTKRGECYHDIMQRWFLRRYNWHVDTGAIAWCPPGVIPAVVILLDILTKPGDSVLMPMPNYDALYGAVLNMERQLIQWPLLETDEGYRMDFERFEELVEQYKPRVMVVASPNNPTGRVWTLDELNEMCTLCERYGITVISDEAHCDLVYGPNVHVPLGRIQPNRQNNIVLMSPNKTFNVGGLMTASVIIPDPRLMEQYRKVLNMWAMNLDTTFGTIAVETLYEHPDCEAWLDAVVPYLKRNVEYVTDFVNGQIEGVKTRHPQGTYLMWLDFTETGLRGTELKEFLVREAKLDLSDGKEFDPANDTHMRMNLGCTFATAKEAMRRLKTAIDKRNAG